MTETMSGDILASQLQVPPDVLVEFIAVYSRLEFALKRVGYVRPKRDREFDIDWDRLAAEIGAGFEAAQSPELSDAVTYLCSFPPKREEWTGIKVAWREVPSDVGRLSLPGVLSHVRRSRNNLFHGGKFATAPDDPARNERVLKAGLTVLDAIVTLSKKDAAPVFDAFHSPNY